MTRNLGMLLLCPALVAGCSGFGVGGRWLSKEDYDSADRRLVRDCSREEDAACYELLRSSSGSMYPELRIALFDWLAHRNPGLYDRNRTSFDALSEFPIFDDEWLFDYFGSSCVWSEDPDADPIAVACEQMHELLHSEYVDPDDDPAERFVGEACGALQDPHACAFYRDRYTNEFHVLANHWCNYEMWEEACSTYDDLDPDHAPHRNWSDAQAERKREQDRIRAEEDARLRAERAEQDRIREQQEAAERAYEREQDRLDREAEARAQQERQDAIMDAIRQAPQDIQDGVERSQRELDEQIRKQNEMFNR